MANADAQASTPGGDRERAIEALTKISHRIAGAEKAHDVAYLQSVLAADLLFRRASGAIVDRRTYLADLPGTHYDEVVAEAVDVHLAGDSAVVTVRVRASGRRAGGTPFSGVYRNVRLFVPGGPRGWECRVWLNTPEPES